MMTQLPQFSLVLLGVAGKAFPEREMSFHNKF
jgi:hypothetical protein